MKTIFLFLAVLSNLYSQGFPGKYWLYLDDFNRPNGATIYFNDNAFQGVESLMIDVHFKSKFLNAVSATIPNRETYDVLKSHPNIIEISHVGEVSDQRVFLPNRFLTKNPLPSAYGYSDNQLHLLHIVDAHENGFTGKGMRIAVFDAGFYTQHPAFSHLNLIKTYDFVDLEDDVYKAGARHGTATLSLLAAYDDSLFIGAAYDASFLLARTEDIYSESPAEEDNWIAALEWADSIGVDIISSSLNYFEFDDASQNYSLDDLDGETAAITRATNVAASRGILVVNSMGNEGTTNYEASTLWSPADGKHVLSVGAIDFNGVTPSWSSLGPSADGRIKPNVVGPGVGVSIANEIDGYSLGNGTSYATPLIAGAAALVWEANRQLTPDELIVMLQNESNNAATPNNSVGWGLPNIENLVNNQETRFLLRIFPNPAHQLNFSIELQRPWGS